MLKRLFYLCLMFVIGQLMAAHAVLVSGTVKDESGASIPTFRLEFQTEGGQWFWRTFSQGAFEVEVPAGEWRISRSLYNGDGTLSDYLNLDYLITVGQTAIFTNLIFPKLNSHFEGKLLTQSGQPIEGVQIDFRRMMGTRELFIATDTDSNGVFQARVPDGTWTVNPYRWMEPLKPYNPIPPQLITVVGETNSAVLFTAYSPTNFIRGRVIDDGGAPIANLQIAAWLDYGNFRFGTTDAEGNYSIGVYDGYWGVEAQDLEARRLLQNERFSAQITSSAPQATVNMQLWRRPFTLDVFFVDENGNAAVTTNIASVQAYSIIGGGRAQLYGPVVNGRASFAVAPGVWSLQLMTFGGLDERQKITAPMALVTDSSTSVNVIIRKGPFMSRFFGQIVDEQGNGLPNFAMRLGWITNYTGVGGEFDITLPADGYYLASAQTNYALPQHSITLTPNRPTERRLVARKLDLNVTVRMNFPSNIIPRWRSVNARTRVGGGMYSVSHDSPDAATTMALFPGTWTFTAFGSGFITPDKQIVTIDSSTQEVVFNFTPPIWNATLQGRIIDHTGAPVRYTPVGAGYGDTQTDESGKFRMDVVAGEIECWTHAPFPFQTAIPVSVKPGETLDMGEVRMPQVTRTLTLNLVEETGEPLRVDSCAQNYVLADGQAGSVKYSTSDFGYNNRRTLLVMPGTWRAEIVISEEGLVAPAPIEFVVGDSDLNMNVPVRRLAAVASAPHVTLSKTDSSERILRLNSASARYVDVETSTDLQTWRFHSWHTMTNRNIDLKISNPEENAAQFFRAVNAYSPFYE